MKKAGILLFLIAFLLIANTSSVYAAHYDFSDAFGQFFDGWRRAGYFNMRSSFWHAMWKGNSFSEAADYVGEKEICPLDFPTRCYNEDDEAVLHKYVWEPSCRGYDEDCCKETIVKCRDLLSKEATGYKLDWKELEDLKLCRDYDCVPKGTCSTDTDCKNQIYCPMVQNGPETVSCDEEFKICYCAGVCGDGYCDFSEAMKGSCPKDCPEGIDSDNDGVSDVTEFITGTGNVSDTDKDGLSDWQEVQIGTDPNDPDTDDGGVCDGPKAVSGKCSKGPDPCPLDSENNCYEGLAPGDSPVYSDTDRDGIPNSIDHCPVDPSDACYPGNDPDIDTDRDGLPDKWSLELGIGLGTDDADNDGLTNALELELGIDPLNPDSDSDGLPDGWEILNGVDDPYADPDNDGIINLYEYYASLDPFNPDSDNDGTPDGEEGLIPQDEDRIELRIEEIYPSEIEEGAWTFNYGDTVQQIIVDARYSNGASLLQPFVVGNLNVKGGAETIPIFFNSTIENKFVASPNYDILKKNDEGGYLSLDVFAMDVLGKNASYSTRIYIANIDKKLLDITVRSPEGTYAYGQNVPFEVVPNVNGVRDLEMEVFVEGAGDEFSLFQQGDSFVGEYPLGLDSPDPLPFFFIVRATGESLGSNSVDALKRIEIRVKPLLNAEYLGDESGSGILAFSVSYPDGSELPDKNLEFEMGDFNDTVAKSKDGLYEIVYEAPGGEQLAHFIDAFGNIGKAKMSLPQTQEVIVDTGGIVWTVLLVVIIFFAAFFAYNYFTGKTFFFEIKKDEKKDRTKRKKELVELIDDIKKRYYKNQISKESAQNKIADYEGQLMIIEKELQEDSNDHKRRHK